MVSAASISHKSRTSPQQSRKIFRNNGVINESQRANLICSIYCNSRAFFGTIATAENLHNGTGPKASLESIHALIGTNIYLNLQDVPTHLYTTTQKPTVSGGSAGQGLKPRNTREPDKEECMVMIPFHPILKDVKKEIREAGRRILPKNLLKVSGLGENLTVSDLTPPEQPKTCTIEIFNR